MPLTFHLVFTGSHIWIGSRQFHIWKQTNYIRPEYRHIIIVPSRRGVHLFIQIAMFDFNIQSTHVPILDVCNCLPAIKMFAFVDVDNLKRALLRLDVTFVKTVDINIFLYIHLEVASANKTCRSHPCTAYKLYWCTTYKH